MIPVILSGGKGTRLWPVSRAAFPKQFCELLDEPLFMQTVRRLLPLGSPWTITVGELQVLTERSLNALQVPSEQVLYEPFGRNTAPAIALLCQVFKLRGWSDQVVGIFPADHLIADESAFLEAVRLGEKFAAQGEIVTLGITPTRPATGYGYIETAGDADGASGAKRAIRFREKPSEAVAREFLAAGGFYWNAGMFIFKVSRMLELLEKHVPEIARGIAGLNADLSNLEAVYQSLPSISIDYAIMEKLEGHVCVPGEFAWNDLGSWDMVAEQLEARMSHVEGVLSHAKDGSDFSKFGRDGAVTSPVAVVNVGGDHNVVAGGAGKAVGFVDVSDLIVVETSDALLVAKRGSTEKVKDVLTRLEKAGVPAASLHRFEVRPWGTFEILRDTDHFKSKTITIDVGAQISYQSHAKRSEHWIIVKGAGEVVIDDRVIQVKAGDHAYIPVGAKHRMRNTGSVPLEFVEVQLGTYFGEDDIVRWQDDYGRVPGSEA